MSSKKPVLICIIGVDGVGKTTHAQKLLDRLKNRGVRCRYTWFRFYHFISLFLLAYCRLAGLTIYETKSGQKMGRHEFYRSKLISFLYPRILFGDMLPMYFMKIFLPLHFGWTVICDRFIYDTLIDLMMDLSDLEIHRKKIGKYFIKLIPKNTHVVLLDLNESIIRERRKDLIGDPSLEMRRRAYYKIAKDFNISMVSNDRRINDVHERIIRTLGVDMLV